jgi:hypothetical protein
MIKLYEGNYEILEWKGEEYYRFGSAGWMQLMGMSLEEVYDQTELEAAYQVLVGQSSVAISSDKYKTTIK